MRYDDGRFGARFRLRSNRRHSGRSDGRICGSACPRTMRAIAAEISERGVGGWSNAVR